MFESSFHFNCVGYKKSLQPEFEGIWYYSFKTPKHRYIIEVEHYIHDIYVVQYYPAYLKNHPKKFQIMTNEHQCRGIVGTCVKIMFEIWTKNPLASFGFIGANTYDPLTRSEESIVNTKRWRVYRHAMENHFGTETFAHGYQQANSRYVMLNKKKDVHELNQKVNELFAKLYDKH